MNFAIATDFIRAAAGHLITLVANSEQSLAKVEANNPLVVTAVQLARAEATGLGIPLLPLEDLAAAALTVARVVAGGVAAAADNVPVSAGIANAGAVNAAVQSAVPAHTGSW